MPYLFQSLNEIGSKFICTECGRDLQNVSNIHYTDFAGNKYCAQHKAYCKFKANKKVKKRKETNVRSQETKGRKKKQRKKKERAKLPTPKKASKKLAKKKK